ncbi:hypothetical protein PAE4_30619 [Bacillus altitudinis]|nr:hypothetical protein PAE4_30619 [Bacillus altitudinis]
MDSFHENTIVKQTIFKRTLFFTNDVRYNINEMEFKTISTKG